MSIASPPRSAGPAATVPVSGPPTDFPARRATAGAGAADPTGRNAMTSPLRLPAIVPSSARLAVLVLVLAGPVEAQGDSPFRPLELPAPSAARAASGRPGAGYWQQRVDYRIEATLDPAANEVRGRETITYGNRSPDTLRYLWLHVEQNICAPESIANQLDQPPLVFLSSSFDFSCKGFAGGGRLESLTVAGREAARARFGTTLRVDLPQPLAPGASLELVAAWSFKVPDYGAARMGRDGTLYEIAQWYPRL